jgi:WD40 repeat protein
VTEVLAPPTRAEPAGEVKRPFVGLRSFGAAEAAYFFGRDDDRRIVAANLRANRLTLLYGPSGVGKSSILTAGVARDLREEARRNRSRRGAPQFAVVLFNSWKDDPVTSLVRAVEREVVELAGEPAVRPAGDTLADLLVEWSDVLGGTLFVILDGFEEFFLYHGDEDGPGTFGWEFARAVARRDVEADFLLSIREDAYAKLDRFEDRIPRLFENNVRLEPLSVAQAREAIRGPLEAYNERFDDEPVVIEDALVETVLEQTARPDRLGFGQAGAGDPDGVEEDRVSAPFLQLVLDRLWDEERKPGSGILRLSTFRRLGETRGIVETHVRKALDALDDDEQEVAGTVFQFLVTRSGAKVAHSADDLEDFSGVPRRRIAPVLEKLSGGEARILNPVPTLGADARETRYELYHDVLAEAVLDWRAERLGAAETRAAEEQARLAKRRARHWAAGAAAALVALAICLVLLVVAIHERHKTESARKTARTQELIAESDAMLPTDPDGALRKAEQALEVTPSSAQAESAFRTAVGASQLRVAIRHSRGAISSAAYSGDGRRVMTLGTDKTATVSDARTGRLISRIGYGTNLTTADLSRDGRIVVTAGDDDTVRLWNASNGRRLATFDNPKLSGAWLDPTNPRRSVAVGSDGGLRIWRLGARVPLVLRRHGAPLTQAAFSPNGKLVAAIGVSRDAWLFDARTGAPLHTLQGHSDTIDALAWSRDSRRLVTGGNDDWWRVWDVATGSAPYGNQDSGPISAVALSPDGSRVATASGNHASLWTTARAVPISRLEGHSGAVTGVDFNRDGRLLVTSSTDGTARVWNLATRTTLTELRGNGGAVSSAVFSPDGRFVLTASDDRTARIWDVDTGLALWTHTSAVTDARFALHGKIVATGGLDQAVTFSNARTGEFLATLRTPQDGPVHSIRFSPNGKLLAVATDDPALLVRYAGNGRPITRLKGNRAGVVEAVFDPHGKDLAVADADGSAGVFTARTGRLVHWLREQGQERAHPLGRVNGIAWSPDGRFLVTVGSDSQVRVWDASSGRYLRTLFGHIGSVTSVAFGPRSDRIVTTGVDRTAVVWDVASRRRLAVLQGDPQPLYSAAFSPDGRWVVTGDSGGVVRVWDWRAEKMLAAIPAHAGPVNAVSFSPDGTRILSASDDWSAKIYRCTTCIPLQQLRYQVHKREQLIEQ